MNGNAVLPMAVAAELMCQAAVATNQGLEFFGYDNMRIQKGVVLSSDSVLLKVFATVAEPVGGGTFRAMAEIKSDGPKVEFVNAKAEIILAPKGFKKKGPEGQKVDCSQAYNHSMEEVYEKFLFHGEFLQAITDVTGWSKEGINAISNTSLPVEDWFANSKFTNWQSDPLMIDAAYQLMILYTTEALGGPSLPNFAQSYRQYIKSFDGKPVIISAKAAPKGTSAATATIQFKNMDGYVLAEIKGYECTINAALSNAFNNRNLGV